MIACQNGHVDIVKVLLQHGASVLMQNKVKLLLLKSCSYASIIMQYIYIFCITNSYFLYIVLE